MIAFLLAAVLASPSAGPPTTATAPGPPPPPSWSASPLLAPALAASRVETAIKLDGKLDEPAWSTNAPSDLFRQQYPREGAPANEPTVVRVLYDDYALYIGIDCTQKATPIVARLTRRDRVASADRVTVDISSRSDRVTAFHFGVNAAGVLDDGIYFNDNQYSADWDENWQAETALRADGWTAEIRIPLRILRFDDAPEQRWGLQFTRYTALRNETDLWAWRPRSAPGYVSTFGTLRALTGIKPSHPWELRLSGQLKLRFRDAEARAGTTARPHDWEGGLELSGKGHPTQGTTLDLTINPDFGLVEADQVVLNLSTYEVFYPEKRPFFLEGQDSWSTARSVFYSRRIGARPADPTVGAGEILADHVGPSPILGAAKFVGATTAHSSVGLLSAVTGKNEARLVSNGAGISRLADPLTLYNVVRARYLAGLTGDIGLLATATNRLEGSGASQTPNDAYVGAVDGRWRSPRANYVIAGQLVSSVLVNGPARVHPDGIAVVPGTPALGGTITAAKQGGAHWLATVSQSFSGRQLDYNDLGYLDRKNDLFSYADLTYRTLQERRLTTDTAITIAASHRQSLDGIRLEDHFRLSTSATFTNFWAASATAYYYAPHFDDRETKDGTALERAGLVGAELWGGTDARRLFTGTAWVQAQRFANAVQVQGVLTMMMRPSPTVDLELLPQALYTSGEPRFIERDQSFYYFGRLRARNVGVTARATVGLSPRLTLQLYSQLFLATTEYSEPTQFRVAGGAFRSEIRLANLQRIAPWPVPNSQQAILNVNAVLRWEYRLGSLVYLIYTRAQSPTVAPMGVPRLDAGSLAGNRASTDTVMLKISYWWG